MRGTDGIGLLEPQVVVLVTPGVIMAEVVVLATPGVIMAEIIPT